MNPESIGYEYGIMARKGKQPPFDCHLEDKVWRMMEMVRDVRILSLLMFAATPMLAQSAPPQGAPLDSASFVVMKGADTVAVERFQRFDVTWKGNLVLRREHEVSEQWSLVTAPDGSVPLIEVTVSEKPDDPRMKARKVTRTRLIIRDDSVSVDQMTSHGLVTRVLPTEAGVKPYLNLSFGLLEMAIQQSPRDSVTSIPFLNLGGGQTVRGSLVRKPDGKASLTLGQVVIELALSNANEIESAAIAAQDLMVVRRP